MKTYNVTFKVTHESYSGYTHNDGFKTVEVKARNTASARKKAEKMASKFGGGYDYSLISII